MLSHLDLRKRRRDEKGLTAVIFALVAVILLVTAGMVVDLGLARDTRRQSQNAADASALAAANVLYPSSGSCQAGPIPRTPPCFVDAVAAAKAYALQNFRVSTADWSGCADTGHYYVETGETQCISFADDSLGTTRPAQPTKLRVVIPTRNVKTSFGVLAGVTQVPINSIARAALVPGTARSCGLCLLGTDVSDLGNGDVTVNGGSVHSNGTIDSGPNGHMNATPSPNTISVVGTCPGNCSPVAQTGVAPIADPYASIAMPSVVGLPVKTDPCNQGPGIYGSTSIPNSTCNLQPGLYVLTGTWENGNNTLLRGTGVTIYATCGTPGAPQVCTSGQSGGRLDTKNGDLQIVAPTTGALQGYAIIYDRENTSALNMQGNGSSSVTGAIYAPKALLEFPGNSCTSVTNGPIIVGSLYGNGNTGCVDLISSVGATIPAPPAGASLDQ
jgi:Putative Flp pilus-assembly TadE/G-like